MKFDPNKKCIIRAKAAGVFFGTIKCLDGATVEIENVRRLWCWDGACSLSELATLGTTAPDNCKFTVTVPSCVVMDVIEIIPCSDYAARQIEEIKAWKRH